MNIDTEYTIDQIEKLFIYNPIIHQGKNKIYLNKKHPKKINVYIHTNKITYKNSESVGLIFFRLLILKKALQ